MEGKGGLRREKFTQQSRRGKKKNGGCPGSGVAKKASKGEEIVGGPTRKYHCGPDEGERHRQSPVKGSSIEQKRSDTSPAKTRGAGEGGEGEKEPAKILVKEA